MPGWTSCDTRPAVRLRPARPAWPHELQLAAGACVEQGQLWRIKPNGIPDTEHPIWVFDDQVDETGTTGEADDPGVVVDFFHSATFSWDGSVVRPTIARRTWACPCRTRTVPS